MKLTIRRPCSGFQWFNRDTLQYEDVFCHPSWDVSQMVSYGSLQIEVVICGCADGDKWGRRQLIHDFVGEHYAPLILSSKEFRRFAEAMLAYRTGLHGQHEHSWDLCQREGCGKAAEYSHEWTLDPAAEIAKARGGNERERRAFGDDSVYCSWECYAMTHDVACPVCGEQTIATFDSRRVLQTANSIAVALEPDELHYAYRHGLIGYDGLMGHGCCSHRCVSRHIDYIKAYVRQSKDNERELKCVKQQRKLMALAKKHLRNNNLEALSSLQEEFAQVATLRE